MAAKRLGFPPKICLVFEDAPNGTLAANSAGMAITAIPDSNMGYDLYPEADAILNSMKDFRPETWGLPPFR